MLAVAAPGGKFLGREGDNELAYVTLLFLAQCNSCGHRLCFGSPELEGIRSRGGWHHHLLVHSFLIVKGTL